MELCQGTSSILAAGMTWDLLLAHLFIAIHKCRQQLKAHCIWISPSNARATNADGSYPESALLLGRSGIITLAGPLLAPRHSRGDGLANACFDSARESCKSSLYS